MRSFFREKKYLIPFIFLVMIYPLIVQAKNEVLKGDFYKYWNGAKNWTDFFTLYKSQALIFTAIILVFICLFRIFEDKKVIQRIKKMKYIFILAGVYALLIIASTIFSANRKVALFGFVESKQGMLVQLSYIIVFLSVIILIKKLKDIKVIINSLLIGSLIMSVIGIFQYLGMNIWQSGFGKNLMTILNPNLRQFIAKAKFVELVYGTLFHKDYLGSYYALIVPLSLGMTIFSEKLKSKLLYGGVFIISIYTLIICESRGGLGGAIFGMVVVFIFSFRKVLTSWKKVAIVAVSLCVVITGTNFVLNGKLGKQANDSVAVISNNVKGLFQENNEFDITKATELKEVINEENRVGFSTQTETIVLSVEEGTLKFYDEEKNPLTYKVIDGNKIQLDDKRYKEYEGVLGKKDDTLLITLKKGRIYFYYKMTGNNIKMINNKFNEIDNIPVESLGFNGKEELFTVRGYIWSRSLPLLKDAIILGYGPDTFAINFPQQDFIGKLYGYDDMWHLVDKPHNMYLQIALDTGVVSLVAYLGILVITIFTVLKSSWKNKEKQWSKYMILSVLSSIVAYLITGVINDNRVSVAPLFYLLLGCCAVGSYVFVMKEAED
ncbi:O-antigen ligase family protein [Oceanirhabdus seepicola]|uniref:O-antigen ligase family protein n=1 Tax=Oceanirhabdus seepicola TaxID=2828781 RepID=A0A9J6P309_9CLOT|nr:O-antigen ligase family protein [Oceanirhabdus seepicola]MCM1990269.1 O-antigen ligase family protein [Oceanirhabdus seepicola]